VGGFHRLWAEVSRLNRLLVDLVLEWSVSSVCLSLSTLCLHPSVGRVSSYRRSRRLSPESRYGGSLTTSRDKTLGMRIDGRLPGVKVK
jgi:hypothetical protein